MLLLEKITLLDEIEASLKSQLKQIKAERKALKSKVAKLNKLLRLQAEAVKDPDLSLDLIGSLSQHLAEAIPPTDNTITQTTEPITETQSEPPATETIAPTDTQPLEPETIPNPWELPTEPTAEPQPQPLQPKPYLTPAAKEQPLAKEVKPTKTTTAKTTKATTIKSTKTKTTTAKTTTAKTAKKKAA